MERNRSLFHSDDVSIKLVHGKLISITSSGPVWPSPSTASTGAPPNTLKVEHVRRWSCNFAYEKVEPQKPAPPAPALVPLFLQGAGAFPNRPSDHRAAFCSNFPGFVRLHLKRITLITQVLKCLLWIIMTDGYARCSSCKGLFGKVYFSFNITCFTQIETRETRWIYVFFISLALALIHVF